MTRMVCLECGFNFDTKENKECPVCKNGDDKYLIKSIDTSGYQMHELGICDDKEIKADVKKLLNNKIHSAAYIKICARELERHGMMHLAMVLDEIACRKTKVEADLLEAFGMKEDIRLNLNNVIMKAEEDVRHAAKLAVLAKNKDIDAVHDLMHEMAKAEAETLAAMNGVLQRYLIESKPKI